jgi:hypothetical protein
LASHESRDVPLNARVRFNEKHVSYDLREHRHRFEIWAAARASQRGFTTVGALRDALQATDTQMVLCDPDTLRLSQDEFNELHQRWCRLIRSRLRKRAPNATYGRAAKLVAVYLKATVIMGENCDSPLGRNLHPPIDRTLLQGLASSDRITSPHKTEWRSINWTALTEKGYFFATAGAGIMNSSSRWCCDCSTV